MSTISNANPVFAKIDDAADQTPGIMSPEVDSSGFVFFLYGSLKGIVNPVFDDVGLINFFFCFSWKVQG